MDRGSVFCSSPDKISVTVNKYGRKKLQWVFFAWYSWVQTIYLTHLFASLRFSCDSVWAMLNSCCFFLDHPYFVGVQYHPEYISRPVRPSPPYLGLILAAIGKLPQFIARGCRLSPRCSISEDEDEDDEELAKLTRIPEFNL